MFLFKSNAENEAGRLVSRLLFVFQKSFISGKTKWSAAQFQYTAIVLNLAYNKNKLHKNFLEKDLEIVSQPHFVYDLLRKIFLMLFSINCSNLIACLSLLLEIMVNICTRIEKQPSTDVLKKRCSENMQQIYRRTPMLMSDFN